MPGYNVQSGAAAFSNTLEEAMLNREKQKRQDMLDHLAVQKAAREVDTEANKAEEHRQDLAERRLEHEDASRWRNEAQKREDKKLADKEAADLAMTKGREAFVAGLPEGPQKTAYQGEQFGLKNVLPQKETGPTTEPQMRQRPSGPGPAQRLVDGKWVDVLGDVPAKAHWETQPAPKEAGSGSAAADRENTHRDNVHQQAITSLDKMETPYEDQLKSLRSLGVSLAQEGNPKADALIAIELLKSTVAGGGLRLTTGEINQELKGSRTKWQDLQLKMHAWGGDSTKPLVLDADEKKAVRSLAKALRKKAQATLEKFNSTRDEIDNSKSPDEINKARTRLHKHLASAEEDDAETTTSDTVPTVGGTFQGGKVLKVTPFK